MSLSCLPTVQQSLSPSFGEIRRNSWGNVINLAQPQILSRLNARIEEAIKNGLLAEFTTLFHEEQSLGDIASIK